MEEPKNKRRELKIDESGHQSIPTIPERLVHTAVSMFLGFILFQIIGFWVFPGLGWYGLRPFKGYLGFAAFIEVVDIIGFAAIAICAVMGWFRGKYFVDRLAGYFNFWKFW